MKYSQKESDEEDDIFKLFSVDWAHETLFNVGNFFKLFVSFQLQFKLPHTPFLFNQSFKGILHQNFDFRGTFPQPFPQVFITPNKFLYDDWGVFYFWQIVTILLFILLHVFLLLHSILFYHFQLLAKDWGLSELRRPLLCLLRCIALGTVRLILSVSCRPAFLFDYEIFFVLF